MGKARLILMVLFVLTLSSGLVAGMLFSRFPPSKGVAVSRTPLAEELNLTPEQNEKMRVIWEGVRGRVDDCFVRAQDIQKKRDAALLALLTDEQKVKFAKLQQDCSESLAALKDDRNDAFSDAVKQTEKMLTETQRARYHEILQGRLHRGPHHDGPHGNGPDWLSPEFPGSQPAHVK